jgi:hypothetical protein
LLKRHRRDMVGDKIIVLNRPWPAGVVIPIRVVALPNSRSLILHKVKDEACYESGIMFQNICSTGNKTIYGK